MSITFNPIRIAQIKPAKTCLLLLCLSLLSLMPVMANELSSKQYTVSQGVFTKNLNKQQRTEIIKGIKLTSQADQLTGKASAKTREFIVNSRKKAVKSSTPNATSSNFSPINSAQNYDAEFAIYGATSLLQEDYDGDGYYQTFSVIFDADLYSYTHNQLGEVYALLYLSKNGGPWTHYFTTDDFIIEGDSDADEYEVITTFLSGYTRDEYDVLIDLYQVGYDDIVASYSSDDSNALYALPLESADYDEVYVAPYVEVVEVHGGGSISILLLILFATCYFRFQAQDNKIKEN